MELWSNGLMGKMIERKNINRGFKKLRVWQDAISQGVIIFQNSKIPLFQFVRKSLFERR